MQSTLRCSLISSQVTFKKSLQYSLLHISEEVVYFVSFFLTASVWQKRLLRFFWAYLQKRKHLWSIRGMREGRVGCMRLPRGGTCPWWKLSSTLEQMWIYKTMQVWVPWAYWCCGFRFEVHSPSFDLDWSVTDSPAVFYTVLLFSWIVRIPPSEQS